MKRLLLVAIIAEMISGCAVAATTTAPHQYFCPETVHCPAPLSLDTCMLSGRYATMFKVSKDSQFPGFQPGTTFDAKLQTVEYVHSGRAVSCVYTSGFYAESIGRNLLPDALPHGGGWRLNKLFVDNLCRTPGAGTCAFSIR